MQLGVLNSIVEVGIGLNLAFGVVQQFRERLSEHLRQVTLKASSRIQLQLQNALTQLQATSNGHLPAAISQAADLSDSFEAFTKRHQDKFVGLAVAASLGLLAALPYLVVKEHVECTLLPLCGLEALAVGPVGSWAGILVGFYFVVRCRLWLIWREHQRDIRAYEKLFKVSVHPKKPTP